VTIKLGRLNGDLVLSIDDDGNGFEVDGMREEAISAATLGVRGMKERAEAVGGWIEIDSAKGKGTTIRASFPIAAPEA
jgi:signal transduction histidine kinase